MEPALTEIPEAEPRSITARVLAPLALVACALAVFLLIEGTSGNDGANLSGPQDRQRTEQRSDRPELRDETYIVAPGDTLSSIAARAGVPLARLERLNAGIDVASLNAGQQIRLRR